MLPGRTSAFTKPQLVASWWAAACACAAAGSELAAAPLGASTEYGATGAFTVIREARLHRVRTPPLCRLTPRAEPARNDSPARDSVNYTDRAVASAPSITRRA